MKKISNYKIILIILIIVLLLIFTIQNKDKRIFLTYEGMKIKVQKNDNNHEAYQKLYDTNMQIKRLSNHFDHLLKKYPNHIKKNEMKRFIHFTKHNSIDEMHKTYHDAGLTIDKRDVRVCVRTNTSSSEIENNKNATMYVTLHELGHVITESIGHSPEFWDNFAFLIANAINIGIYKYTNWKEKPVYYCGVLINLDLPTHDHIKNYI